MGKSKLTSEDTMFGREGETMNCPVGGCNYSGTRGTWWDPLHRTWVSNFTCDDNPEHHFLIVELPHTEYVDVPPEEIDIDEYRALKWIEENVDNAAKGINRIIQKMIDQGKLIVGEKNGT